jgi:hypothetical protein
MKSNVKVAHRDRLTRLRARTLQVLGLGLSAGCKTAADTDGLVVVPMLETAPSSSASDAPDAGPQRVSSRSLREPHAPNGQTCKRNVECIPPLASAPTYPYAHPYERCDPSPIGEAGHLSARETDDRRQSEPDVCCYVSFDGCARPNVRIHPVLGRPLRDADDMVVTAETVERVGWSADVPPGPTDANYAREWTARGAAEHASVAEFARLTLTLLALGAPADLVEAAQRAALDEIEHARTCFAFASRHLGRTVGPGLLRITGLASSTSLATLVRETLRDGCYGETLGALELHALAEETSEPWMADTLRSMARDEERHAELAWRIVRHAASVDAHTTRTEMQAFLAALERTPVADAVVRPCAEALLSVLAPAQLAGDSAPVA